jgi:hypothetical protein
MRPGLVWLEFTARQMVFNVPDACIILRALQPSHEVGILFSFYMWKTKTS